MVVPIETLKYKKAKKKKKHFRFNIDGDTNVLVRKEKNKDGTEKDILVFGNDIFKFDYKNYMLYVNDNMYTMKKKYVFNSKAERLAFCEDIGLIDTERDNKTYQNDKSQKWENKFSTFMKHWRKSNVETFEEQIYDFVEKKKVSPTKNELIQALRDLLLDVDLCKTYNKYLVPLKNNVTVPVSENDILQIIVDLTDIRNISSKTLKETLTFFNQEVDIDYHLIKTNNGFFDFNKGEFFTESDKILIINKRSPYNYREELVGAKPPALLQQFFDSTFREETWKIQGLLEIFGYMLDDGNKYQLMPILIGAPRAGKGICFKLLGALVSRNVSSVDVFNVDFNSKYTQDLITADINIIEEFKGCVNIAEVKGYLGEGGLTIARIYEETRYYSDLEVPKTILSTNNLGGMMKTFSQDFDVAFLERLKLVLEFDYTIPPENRDSELHLKLINDQEVMDWLLTNSLHAYSKIKNATDFKCLKSIREMNDILEKYQHPKEYYLRECFKYDVEAWETERELKAFENLVSVSDVRDCIYEKFEIDLRHVRSCVCTAFDLRLREHETYKDEYVTIPIRNGDKVNQYIKGLVRIKKEDEKNEE